MAWCYKLTESDGVRYRYSKICQHGFQIWRITDQPLISCNCGLLLHLFSGMSTNNANFCHNNSSQLRCKKWRIKSSLVQKTAKKAKHFNWGTLVMTMAWSSAHLCPLDCQHLAFLLFNSPQSCNSLFQPQPETVVILWNRPKKSGKRIQICWLHNDVADTHITPPCLHS